ARLFVQMMLVHRRHVDAICSQCSCNGVDFAGAQDEITSYGSTGRTAGLEVDGGCHTHGWQQLMAIFENSFRARHAVLNDAAIGATGVAEDSVQHPNIE